MQVIHGGAPVHARGFRSIELVTLGFDDDSLHLVLDEEDSRKRWELLFRSIQAFRVTTEELIPWLRLKFPAPGAFFEVADSDWIKSLGLGTVPFLDRSRHFIICCYDQIIEVMALSYEFRELLRQ